VKPIDRHGGSPQLEVYAAVKRDQFVNGDWLVVDADLTIVDQHLKSIEAIETNYSCVATA
jgi:hypothetical protein